MGYSDASYPARDPGTIAHELHTLFEKAGKSPPYMLAGHSLGGSFVRVFAQLYPDEVVAMLLMDTTHPEQLERRILPLKSDWKFRSMIWLYDVQSVLGDMGIMMLYDKLMGPILQREMEGLPDDINQRSQDFLIDGKYIRAFGKEMDQYHATLERTKRTNNFGSLPIRVFTAAGEPSEEAYKAYLKRGMDLKKRRVEKIKMQK
jgi:pimeloyl-ACP methyl ester carboxylesterase